MDRICIGHSADTTDVDYLDFLLQQGVYLSLDRYPGGGGSPTWQERNATVKELVDRGWTERLMLGHDYAPTPVPAGAARNLGDSDLAPTHSLQPAGSLRSAALRRTFGGWRAVTSRTPLDGQ